MYESEFPVLSPHLSAEAARLQSRHHISDRGADPGLHQPLAKSLVEDKVAEGAVEGGQLRLVDRVEVQGTVVEQPAGFLPGPG